ncbi:MAG: N-acetylmuramoyl-L-alanine amidase [Anaerolineales bacterium]|nr:MAG: N-acetylmuramoyl-L-alanine amidase [Anaerolineales bacterium]
MGTSSNINQSITPEKPRKGTFYYIQVALGVAVLLATTFTAWTDPSLLPGNFGETLPEALIIQTAVAPELEIIPTPRSNPLVALVAGHSGNDSGAVCPDGLTERSINETVAAFARQSLVEKGLDVEVLQEFDPKLDGYQATVLVSIHADSCDYVNDQATGFKVSSALANPHPERAARLTACLRNRYGKTTGLPLHNSITIDMTSYHAFSEISPETTAAIIEVGFMNLDRQLLTQNPEQVASGIVEGILCYVNNEDLSATTP